MINRAGHVTLRRTSNSGRAAAGRAKARPVDQQQGGLRAQMASARTRDDHAGGVGGAERLHRLANQSDLAEIS
jgi:hypothetical protein